MKKIPVIILTILAFYSSTFVQAQNIDSVSFSIGKSSGDSSIWGLETQRIDSFSSGRVISHLDREWLYNSWENKELTTYSYSGNLLSERIYAEWNNFYWKNDTRWLFTYSATIDSIVTQKWNSQWVNNSLEFKCRNYMGLDSLILTQVWINMNWDSFKKVENTYGSDSLIMTSITSYTDTSGQWYFNEKKIWYRDSFQRDTSVISQRFNAGIWEDNMRYFVQYDSLGRLVYKENAEWNDGDSAWTNLHNYTSYTYDSLNRIKTIANADIPGSSSFDVYSYDSLGVRNDIMNRSYSMGDDIYRNYHVYYFRYPPSTTSNPLSVFLQNDFSICDNYGGNIGAFAIGGNYPLRFQWTPATGLFSDTIENPYVFVDTTTTYILSVTDANNNVIQDSIHIEIYPQPIISSIQSIPASCDTCHNGSFIITATGDSTISFHISPFNSGTVVNNTIINLSPGSYEICVNTSHCYSCQTDSIFDGTVGIRKYDGASIKLHPNPFTESAELMVSPLKGNLTFIVFDVWGRRRSIELINSQSTTISRHNLSSGIYFGILLDDNKLVEKITFVVQDK